MKKLIAVLIVVCVAFAGLIGWGANGGWSAKPAQDNAEAEEITIQSLDYAAIFASHDADEVVMTVNGKDISWAQYLHWLFFNGAQIENYMGTVKAYYGQDVKWTDTAPTGAGTFADYLFELVEENVIELGAVNAAAEKSGAVDKAALESYLEEIYTGDRTNYCGENATDADFEAFLSAQYLTRSVYDSINTVNFNYMTLHQNFIDSVNDAEAIAFLEKNDYKSAHHILFISNDLNGEPYDDETQADLLAKAEAISAELKAIEDDAARLARLVELKAQYDEDSGRNYYPNGYTYTPGTMVPQFEDAVSSLGEYEVSDVVRTDYGYHIIMRLPLDPDALIDVNAGETARILAADEKCNAVIEAEKAACTISYAPGFEKPDITAFFK